MCSGRLKKEGVHFICTKCNKKEHPASKPAVNALIVKGDKILLSIRRVEPKKGTLDVPGGFLLQGEHPEDGLKRELLEEANIIPANYEYFGIYVNNNYEYQNEILNVLDIQYLVKSFKGKIDAQDDVGELKWFEIDKIPLEKVGFESAKKTLEDLQKRMK